MSNAAQRANDLGRLVVWALGHAYQAEMRGLIGNYLADAEGVPVDIPVSLLQRISEEVGRSRHSLLTGNGPQAVEAQAGPLTEIVHSRRHNN
ncbi:hypothetical protein ACIQZO_39190 [Streptomyces sp. NPDC097617]|uniref:hypothetical protein n=1 Tax=Streptomyces sp. NPDC097617 TaxID=3366091 RepID=UPI0038215017